ncbi:hypothetical protein Peur_004771 [Populus x canadensis]
MSRGHCPQKRRLPMREKPLKSQERGREETAMKVPSRSIQNTLKKVAAPRRFAKPTMLLMQFPRRQSAFPQFQNWKEDLYGLDLFIIPLVCFGNHQHAVLCSNMNLMLR